MEECRPSIYELETRQCLKDVAVCAYVEQYEEQTVCVQQCDFYYTSGGVNYCTAEGNCSMQQVIGGATFCSNKCLVY